jgi:hypothetical protein
MTKAYVDELIRNMKLAGIVTKAAPWTYEGFGDSQKNVRYIGLTLKDDWLEIFSERDNVLLKFITDRNSGYVEYYLANKPPFIKISGSELTEGMKWELLLGEWKRRLKKDKHDVIHHTETFSNLYAKIKLHVKA